MSQMPGLISLCHTKHRCCRPWPRGYSPWVARRESQMADSWPVSALSWWFLIRSLIMECIDTVSLEDVEATLYYLATEGQPQRPWRFTVTWKRVETMRLCISVWRLFVGFIHERTSCCLCQCPSLPQASSPRCLLINSHQRRCYQHQNGDPQHRNP